MIFDHLAWSDGFLDTFVIPIDKPFPTPYNDAMHYRQLETHLTAHLHNLSVTDLPSRKEADHLYATHRSMVGFNYGPGTLLSKEVAKLLKGDGTRLMMLALLPASASGHNVCPFSTEGCRAHCVAYAGNGLYDVVSKGRMARTNFLVENPAAFLSAIVTILDREVKKGPLAIRLNGFSDIRWERVMPEWFWSRYPTVTFYDYTKHSIVSRPANTLPDNYTLTYSVTERTTPAKLAAERDAGRNVAVVVNVRGGKLRGTDNYRELPIVPNGVDGDKNDRRYADPAGSVVLLRRKGSLSATDPLVQDSDRLTELFALNESEHAMVGV